MNQRLEYVDALRGLSMILVVFGHALLFMGLPTDTTLVGAVLLTFRMPLFFFVSGFFAYKLSTKWTKDKVLDVLSRKVKAQVISTLVFYSIFQICRQKYLFEWLDHGFSWFWFTIALFQMFCIYLVFALIEKRIKSHNFAMLSLIIISLGLRLFNIIHPSIHIRCATIFEWFYLCQYFQFFVFGLLCRKCFKRFETLLNSDWFRTISILTFISSLIALYSYDRYLLSYSTKTYKTIAEFIVRYSGLISLFIIFYSSRNQIESHAGGGVANCLKFIGKRTLDIYMLHVFFLPTLGWMAPYLTDGNNMIIIQLFCGIAISLADISMCLIISKLLRSSTFLSNWLFGSSINRTFTN